LSGGGFVLLAQLRGQLLGTLRRAAQQRFPLSVFSFLPRDCVPRQKPERSADRRTLARRTFSANQCAGRGTDRRAGGGTLGSSALLVSGAPGQCDDQKEY
jgi:hypothetical protein